MKKIVVDFENKVGNIKPMHAVNNGPKDKEDIWESNFNDYAAAGIPYARNHDASFCSAYGGHHSVDVNMIFTNFDADVNDPNSYDFACTDAYTKNTFDAGTKVFYRLGSRIEHEVKKYNTLPPKDFQKWAEICEHIIMHYTEGWANGFHFDLEYWEIWNEPDLDPDDATNKRTWGGTKEQFFDFYEVAAKHLKKRFPSLKIGGPAIAYQEGWTADFLKEMKKRGVEIDFFSWHIYCTEPKWMIQKAERLRALLDENGYGVAESILNEWNYVCGWTDKFILSVETIIRMKGAAFTAACMLAAQHSSIDMLMYYDARVMTAFNGMFDFYTLRPLKGYYPFPMFNALYQLGTSVACEVEGEDVYVVGARDDEGSSALMFAYYVEDNSKGEETVQVEMKNASEKYEVYLLDEDKNMEFVQTVDSSFEITLKRNSVVLLKNVK